MQTIKKLFQIILNMKNTIILCTYLIGFYLTTPLFAQNKPYAELVWKNVEVGDIIGGAGLAITDLNLDGKKEIIATGRIERADHFFIYDYQSGNYKMRWSSNLYPNGIQRLLVTNIDADTDPDILLISGYNFAEIYDGTTLTVIDSFRGSFGEVRSMAIGNVDSLPDKELITIGMDSLRIFSLTTKKLKWAMGIQGGDVKIGDIDGDGRNEIFVGTLSWLMPLQSYVVDGYTRTIRWTIADAPMQKFDFFDVTGDGKLDLIGSNGNSIVYFNTSTRRAITLVNAADGIESFYIGDADSDGKPEILIGSYRSMVCYNFNGSPRWAMRNTDGGATNIAIGNLDSNIAPEVVWGAGANSSGSDHLIIGDFTTQQIKHASLDARYAHKLLLNDLNFDRMPELAVAHLGTYGYDAPDAGDPISHNESALIRTFDIINHSLTSQIRYPFGVNTVDAFAIGSSRRQNLKDFGMSYNTYPVIFDNGLTNPIFETSSISGVRCMTFSDVDGDGIDEWLYGTFNGLIAMKWSGSTYNKLWEMPVTGGVEEIRVQNIDADTAKEFIIYSLQTNVKVFNGVTRQMKWETPNLRVTVMDIVDMDNDHKLDLLMGTDNGEVIIFDMQTQQIKKRNTVFSFTIRTLRGANIDADTFGRAEIIVGERKLKVLDGQTFATKWEIPEHFTSDYGYSVDFADVDGDGHVDLFIGNQSGVFQFRLRDTIYNHPFLTAQKDLPTAAPQLIAQLYPNPTNELITVTLNPLHRQPFIWRVYDINGHVVLEETTFSRTISPALTIPVQQLGTGIYIFQIQTEKSIETRRFVVVNKN